MLTVYIDESYNQRTFCVAGWLCSDDEWGTVETRWKQRVEHERAVSRKKRQKPISRFKASDCANLGGEFRGWKQERQIRFTKKLIEIIGQSEPIGFAVTAGLGDFISGYPQQENQRLRGCYYFCMMAAFLDIGDWMARRHPNQKVTVIYDRGNVSEWAAQAAFASMKNDGGYEPRKYFVSAAPMGWEECVPLQSADLLAYEAFRLVDGKLMGNTELRRSLQGIIGHGVQMRVRSYQPDAFRKLAAMQGIMNEAQGNPTVDLRQVMNLIKSEGKRDKVSL